MYVETLEQYLEQNGTAKRNFKFCMHNVAKGDNLVNLRPIKSMLVFTKVLSNAKVTDAFGELEDLNPSRSRKAGGF